MTDLQIGLLLIGAAAVAGVLIYNRVQERGARREGERAFGGGAQHADVLLKEPTLEAAAPAARPGPIAGDAMPDSRVDYVVNLDAPKGVRGPELLAAWSALERRFARRLMLAGSEGEGWRRIAPGDAGTFVVLQAALQLLGREGVLADAELLEFRSQVEALAAKFGATVAAPEMRQALETARALDRVCADADIQVALHVIGVPPGSELPAGPFQATEGENGVMLTLDLPRTPEPGRSYEAMARSGAQLAAKHGGRLVDDNGHPLDERALASIGAQLGAVAATLSERGIEPGSPLALRLFS